MFTLADLASIDKSMNCDVALIQLSFDTSVFTKYTQKFSHIWVFVFKLKVKDMASCRQKCSVGTLKKLSVIEMLKN